MTLVFMAPIGNDAAAWARVPAAQSAVRHQFPGFGRPRATMQPTMATLADEVAAGYEAPLDLVGVSMGGMVGQHVALRHPELVRSLLVACTGAAVDPEVMRERAAVAEDGGMEAVVEPTLRRWFTAQALDEPDHPGVGYARATLRALDPHCFADGWRAIGTHNVIARLPELNARVTAVAGGRDAASPLARSAQIADRAPDGRLVVVQDAPHMIHLECPARFSEVVDDHLQWAGARRP